MQGGRPGPFIPRMPWFEPSDQPSAKASLLSQTVNENDHFTFPADHDFWNNFVQEVRRYPGAMNAPHYHVDASHTDESVLVNQEFLRRFVSGWERANPHVVVVTGPHGASTFHSSEEFWNRFVTFAGQRSRMRQDRGETGLEDTTVYSKLLPNMAPIHTTQEDWNEICRTWEQEKALGQFAASPPPPKALVSAPTPPPVAAPAPAPATEMAYQPPPQQYYDQSIQLESQRQQIENLQNQLSAMSQQASHNNTAIADELRRAQGEASRYQQESEALRGNQHQLQSEKNNLEARIRSLEQALTGLQGDVSRQREQSEKDLADKERQLTEAKQAADMADLKKELQMRELMQEELFRAKEEAQKEAAEKAKTDAAARQHEDEVACMRRQLGCGTAGCRSTRCRRRVQPQAAPAPVTATTTPPVPQMAYCGQRTVTTQTPPPGYNQGYMQPHCSPPRQLTAGPGPSPERYSHNVHTPVRSPQYYPRGW